MIRRPLNLSRSLRGGLLGCCALLAVAQSAPAQIGTGGGRGGGGGIRLGDDPTDPEKKKAAAQKKADEFFQVALKLLDKGRIPEAKGKLKAAIELVGMEGTGRVALNRLIALHQEGMAKLEHAADLFEQKQFIVALELAQTTKVLYANLFTGLPVSGSYPIVSQEAALLIKQIEGDPEAKQAIQEHEAVKKYRKAERLATRAEKTPTVYYDLYKLLKNIAKHHPDCPTGQECARRAEALENDERIGRIIKLEEDRRFIDTCLRRVAQYEGEGKKDLAKAERAKLEKRFPGKSLEELRRISQKR